MAAVKFDPVLGGIRNADDKYTNATAVPITIGGIEAGTTFENVSIKSVLDQLLYPYQSPSFSSFSISGQSTPIEVGASIAANRTFTWGTTNSSNIQANTVDILDVTGSATIASSLPNTGSYASTYGAVTKTSAGTNQFRVQALNTNAEAFNRAYTVTWQWRRFYGESVDAGPLAEVDIEALRVSGLASGFAGTYAFAAGGYKYLCYPTEFGTATTFKDQSTNLDVPFEAVYTVSVTNAYGVTTDYNIHRTTNILGAAINIVVS